MYKRIVRNSDGEYIGEEILDNDKVLSVRSLLNNYDYKYDDQGRILEKITYSNLFKEEIKYKEIHKYEKMEDNNYKEYIFQDECLCYEVFHIFKENIEIINKIRYNEEGVLLDVDSYWVTYSDNKKVIFESHPCGGNKDFKYDEKGRLIEVTEYNDYFITNKKYEYIGDTDACSKIYESTTSIEANEIISIYEKYYEYEKIEEGE